MTLTLSPIENRFGETLLAGTAASGLEVRLNPRPRWVKTFAAFGANVGSIDRVGGPAGEPVPEGLAHFLEHKLFEDELGDVSDRFARMGASTNAMTGFSGTTYIASTSSEPEPVVELLLDFVQRPYFTPPLVEKEQGIIAQEIRMYDDDPDWRLFFGVLGEMFERHPVRDEIAGSVESIRAIDADVLQHCYDLFYHPRNMCLAVSGPIDVDALAAIVERDQARRDPGDRVRHVRPPVDEPLAVRSGRFSTSLPVSRPRLLLGIKETRPGTDEHETARRKIATRLLVSLLFGRSSKAFEELYGDGLVDETFGASHSAEVGFGFTAVGGDTDDPAALEARLRDVLQRARREGLDADAFARIRNKVYGQMLRTLDSPESVAFELISSTFRGQEPFGSLALVEQTTLDDLVARLDEHVRDDAMVVGVLEPAAA